MEPHVEKERFLRITVFVEPGYRLVDQDLAREAFDLSHIFQAAKMQSDGRIEGPLYVQFVMGVKNAMPADRPSFDYMRETLHRLAPDAEFCGAGIGRHQLEMNEWCIETGGHCRTGLEDNIRFNKDSLAPSNAALVKRAVELCEKHGRAVATSSEAREILGHLQGPARR